MATAKKCSYFERDLVGKNSTINVHVFKKGKDEGQNRELFHTLMNIIRKGFFFLHRQHSSSIHDMYVCMYTKVGIVSWALYSKPTTKAHLFPLGSSSWIRISWTRSRYPPPSAYSSESKTNPSWYIEEEGYVHTL